MIWRARVTWSKPGRLLSYGLALSRHRLSLNRTPSLFYSTENSTKTQSGAVAWPEQPSNIRLLKTDAFELCRPYRRPNSSEYAVLSHTWDLDQDEVSYSDFQSKGLETLKRIPSFSKLQFANDQAKRDGLQYFWADTCCINKSSSAELSEAIRSMYHWYSQARVCYVYMIDVLRSGGEDAFRRSRWFTRAWTLQELLAPREVKFYDREGQFLGRLFDPKCAKVVSEITGIDIDVLLDKVSLNSLSIAQRMSWAANRQATRVEDRAYSLLGIFDVNMPTMYGEREQAFQRLQYELIKVSTDHSIFCWDRDHSEEIPKLPDDPSTDLLAPSPSHFAGFGKMMETKNHAPRPYSLTNRGLEITLRLRSYWEGPKREKLTHALLDCVDKDRLDEKVVLNLQRQFDLDADESNVFKPWTKLSQRRRREVWDNWLGREFDWQFITAYARRGFTVGHIPGGRRISSVTMVPETHFREQTIVLMREAPIHNIDIETRDWRFTANPVASFNELYWMIFMTVYMAGIGLYILIAILVIPAVLSPNMGEVNQWGVDLGRLGLRNNERPRLLIEQSSKGGSTKLE